MASTGLPAASVQPVTMVPACKVSSSRGTADTSGRSSITRSGRADGRKPGGSQGSSAGTVETVVAGAVVEVVVMGMVIVVAVAPGSPVVAHAARTNNKATATRDLTANTKRSVPDPMRSAGIPGHDSAPMGGGTVNRPQKD